MSKWEMVRLGECFTLSSGKFLPTKKRVDGEHNVFGGNGITGKHNEYFIDNPTVVIGRVGEYCGCVHTTGEKVWVTDNALYVTQFLKTIDRDYICYALNEKNLNSFANKSGQPSISQSAILKIEIPLPPLEIQKQIAQTLDTAAELLAMRKQQLAELDNLIKSTFYDMFGDPVANDKGWEIKQLSRCCSINPKKSEIDYFADNFQVSFVAMPSVSVNGDIDTTENKDYKEVKTGFTYFYENDVLFAKITPCMENGKGAIARNLKNNIGFGSTEFHVLRPIEGVSNSEWLYRLTVLPVFRKNAEKNMSGSAGQKRVPTSFFDKFMVSLPPLPLQTQFNEIVTKIEEQKALVKKAIDETQYLFDSLMSEYFE